MKAATDTKRFTTENLNGSVATKLLSYQRPICGHDYAASAANCWKADMPFARN